MPQALWIVVIVLLILALVGAPGLGIPHNYGWYPSGGGFVLVIILIVLLLR